MKKIYLLLFLLSAFTHGFSQTLLSEGFEGNFPPTNWTLINGNSPAGFDWTNNTDLGTYYVNAAGAFYPTHSGGGSMVYEFSSTTAAKAWAIAPGLNLTAGKSYTISFYYAVIDQTYPEKLKVTVGNAPTIAAQTNILWSNNGDTALTNEDFRLGTIKYTPTTSGSFYFGFNCFSNPDQFALIVDDVTIEATPVAVPTCTTNTSPKNNSTNIDADTLALAWNPVAGATSYDVYIGTTNPPTSFAGNSVSNTLSLLLDYSTKYYWYVRPRNGAGVNTGCASSVDSFTTAAAPLVPTCATVVTPANGATNVNDTTTFTWRSVPGAIAYRFILDTINPPADTLGFIADTSITLGSYRYNSTYYWRVVPINYTGEATGCAVNSYTTQAAPPPPACTSTSFPASGAINVSAPNVTLSWNPAPGALGYVLFASSDNVQFDTLDVTSETSYPVTVGFDATIYWKVVPYNGGGAASGCVASSFSTSTAPPVPVNDECTGALVIPADGSQVQGYTYEASESLPAIACGVDRLSGNPVTGNADDDVWFKFTANYNGFATITLQPNESFDGILSAYSGTCNNPVNIGCADARGPGGIEVMYLNNLVAGQTYYVRVYSYGGPDDFATGSFLISATGFALPVTLADFKGEKQNSSNMLTWTTKTEQNNKGFELQRSIDGISYSTLSFIPSKASNGNSSASLGYSFVDSKPFNTNCYYRLKQVNFDGKSELSNVVLLKGQMPLMLDISNVYPNPATNVVKVLLRSPSANNVKLVVTDLAGKTVIQQSAIVTTGDNNFNVPVRQLAKGTYLLKAVCASGCETSITKFVKQ